MSMFKKRREARQEMYKDLKTAVHSRTAGRFNHDMGMNDDEAGRHVTAQTAGSEAIQMVRGLIANYIWPAVPKLAYSGLRRSDNRVASGALDHGVVTITGTVRTPIGVNLGFDIPVEIRRGKMLEPSVMICNGTPMVLSQSAIDAISRDNSAYGQLPTRSMYSSPHTRDEAKAYEPARQERRTPGIFSLSANAKALRELVRTRGAANVKVAAEVGLYGETERPAPDVNAPSTDRDVALRDEDPMACPGATVKLRKTISAPTRGGGRVQYTKGTTATVLRDMAGDGKELYVEFKDGRRGVIPANFLSKTAASGDRRLLQGPEEG